MLWATVQCGYDHGGVLGSESGGHDGGGGGSERWEEKGKGE